jgi:hypothetical protein
MARSHASKLQVLSISCSTQAIKAIVAAKASSSSS